MLSSRPQLVSHSRTVSTASATKAPATHFCILVSPFSSMATRALRGDCCMAGLPDLYLASRAHRQDGAGGGCASSRNAVTQASTLHHGKLERGMWRLMRCCRAAYTKAWLRDLCRSHTFYTWGSPYQCMVTSLCQNERSVHGTSHCRRPLLSPHDHDFSMRLLQFDSQDDSIYA